MNFAALWARNSGRATPSLRCTPKAPTKEPWQEATYLQREVVQTTGASSECRLREALKNYQWFADGGHSDKLFSAGRFYHVYGQLRDFDPVVPPERQIGFSGEHRGLAEKHRTLADAIDQAWNASVALDGGGRPRIRTIGPDEKHAAPEIINAIAEAEYLYFLGYGFDRRNNELLGLGRCSKNVKWQYVSFTNYGNSNKVSKSVERCYVPSQRQLDENGETLGSLMGNSYRKRSMRSGNDSKFTCEKSIKSVYDALAEDFDWPE